MPRCMSKRARRFMEQQPDLMERAMAEIMRKTLMSPTLTLEPGEKILGGLLVAVDNPFVSPHSYPKSFKKSRRR